MAKPQADMRLPLLAKDWLCEWRELDSPDCVPSSLDIKTSAVVLLSGDVRQPTALDIASVMRILLALDGWQSYPIRLVLGMAYRLLTEGELGSPVGLNEPSSAVRIWVIQNAWLLRRRLSPELCTQPLLVNVESTLGGWELSLALCRATHRSEVDFWDAVDEYKPTHFPEQFRSRTEWARQSTDWERPSALVEPERDVPQFLAARLAAEFNQPISVDMPDDDPPVFGLTPPSANLNP